MYGSSSPQQPATTLLTICGEAWGKTRIHPTDISGARNGTESGQPIPSLLMAGTLSLLISVPFHKMPDRAGYQVSVYAVDVSASMGELIDDPVPGRTGPGKQKSKLDFVKEYVARKCEPKVSQSWYIPLKLRSQVGGRLSTSECCHLVAVGPEMKA